MMKSEMMFMLLGLTLLQLTTAWTLRPHKIHLTASIRSKSTVRMMSPDVIPEMTSTSSMLLLSLLQKVDAGQAKGEFFFFFFGGSGALGIGLAQLPGLIQESNFVKSLAGSSTKGGKDLSIFPLATLGYPEALKEDDVQDIINSMPSVEQIYAKGPKKSYMAQRGYLERQGFFDALPKSNSLALYAAYDALAKGGGELAAPQEARDMIARWKDPQGGLDAFKTDLLLATFRKYSAYTVFFFLIALVFDLIVESGMNAFLS